MKTYEEVEESSTILNLDSKGWVISFTTSLFYPPVHIL
jgi:hypothetical protein